MRLLTALLGVRREYEELFRHGSYEPAGISGATSGRILAFERRYGDTMFRCAVALDAAAIGEGAAIRFASGAVRPAADCLADTPIWFEIEA